MKIGNLDAHYAIVGIVTLAALAIVGVLEALGHTASSTLALVLTGGLGYLLGGAATGNPTTPK